MKSTGKVRNAWKVLLGGGLILLLVSMLVGQTAAQTWIELAPTGGPPTPRSASNRAVGYDEANNRMMFFGGITGAFTLLNDTWVLVGADGTAGAPQWVQLATVNTPAPHRNHAGAYDPVNNRLIVHGGCLGACTPLDNNVYVLSNANGLGGTPTWQQLSPTGGPPTLRDAHTAVYDPITNRLIVFGGDNCCGGRFNDTWVLTNANGLGGTPVWIQLFPTGGPPPARAAHSAVYDPPNNRMIVMGGNLPGGDFNDTWVLSNANGLGGTPTWTQLIPSGTPPAVRSGHSAVYDQMTNRMVVFGGADQIATLFNDVSVLTNANGLGGTPAWTQLAPSGTPPSQRGEPHAVYRQATNRMVVFGGAGATGLLNDTWVLTDATGITAKGLKEDAIAELNTVKAAIMGGAPGVGDAEEAVENLNAAIASLQASLASFDPADPNRLIVDPLLPDGTEFFNNEEDAVEEIFDAIDGGLITDPTLLIQLQNTMVNKILEADKIVAETAINDAIAAAGNAGDIADAQAEFATAEGQAAACTLPPFPGMPGPCDDAVGSFEDAWINAQRAVGALP